MPSESGYFPIRELSRRSGINAVTLRAWERRYGLLKPQRSSKGHRLYSQADLHQVQHIVHWLNRGVSVGQVQDFLSQNNPAPIASVWQEHIAQFQHWASNLNGQAIDNACNALFALYPEQTLAEYFFRPLLSRWQHQQYEFAFVQQILLSKLQIRLLNKPAMANPIPLLVLNIDTVSSPLHGLLLSLLLHPHNFDCHCIVLPCRGQDISHLLHSSQSRGLLLICDTPFNADVLHGINVPVFIYGDATILNPGLQAFALPADYHQAVQHIGGAVL